MKTYCVALALLLGLAGTESCLAQSYSFSVINTSLPQTVDARPYSISDAGAILVQTYSAGQQAYIISGSSITTLPGYGEIVGYSAPGWLVGTLYTASFLVDPLGNQVFFSVATYQTTLAVSNINSAGTVVGISTNPALPTTGFTYANGTVTPYTYPKSTGCTLNGINTAGDLAGTYFKDNEHSQFYGFTLAAGNIKQILVPGCIDPNPSSINDASQVVGSAMLIEGSRSRSVGFVHDAKDGRSTVIDYANYAPKTVTGPTGPARLDVGQSKTQVYGVNNAGQIVGEFTAVYQNSSWSETIYIPFLGTPNGKSR